VVIGPLVVGYAVALRRDLATAARNELAMMERWHQLQVERARETERRRIAREMHDVVSHRVGHMVVAAGALETAHQPNPDKVARTAGLIRTEGRHALEELREVLGVLAPDHAHESAPRAPQPDATDLPELVDRARTAGHDATLTVTGSPETLPTMVRQALYRATQEALTNAAKHAPGAQVSVSLHCGPDAAELTVVNGPPTAPPHQDLPGSGRGLLGLRERAALLGGTVDAGPHGDGFRLSVRLPAHPAAANGA
ncbi:sensor histidine kinase, partial [Streptomyces noursei]